MLTEVLFTILILQTSVAVMENTNSVSGVHVIRDGASGAAMLRVLRPARQVSSVSRVLSPTTRSFRGNICQCSFTFSCYIGK